MVIKIGKLLQMFCVSLVVVTSFCADQSLQLRIVSKKNNSAVTKLALGVPYTLEIKAEGAQDLYSCKIPGIENFYSEFCNASHLNLMSHVSTVHSYVLRADKPGTFTLGPVQLVTHDGKVVVSNSLTLHVEKDEQPELFVDMVIDNASIFVGQRVTGKMRIYDSVNAQILNATLPDIDKELGVVIRHDHHNESKQVVNGVTYTCYEIPISFIFKKSGTYALPKVGANCRVPQRKHQSFFGFNVSMQSARDQWYYSTQPLKVTVEPLPPLTTHEHVIGIGIFDSISLQTQQKKATTGEGIVISLEIIGQDGVEDVEHPTLTMAADCKYYESKASYESLKSGKNKKLFEYIVQATKAGNIEIPSQKFTVFDTQTKMYKTLKTQPLLLTITQNGMQGYEKLNNSEEIDLSDDLLCPLKTDGPWTYTPERFLSLLWFVIALSIPFGMTFLYSVKRYLRVYGSLFTLNKKAAFYKNARKKIIALKKNKSYSLLYTFFNEFFAQQGSKSHDQMSADAIEVFLKNAGFDHKTVEQWNRFFLQLSELAYSHVDLKNYDELFNRALVWINQFEERL